VLTGDHLRCRACGSAAPLDAGQACPECWGPLELARVPVVVDRAAAWTPLVRAEQLGRELGLSRLWLKDETANPTGSFKDRVVATALARGRELGCRVAATASTGNLARAVAAAAPGFGMRALVLVPATLDRAEISVLAAAGAAVVAVEGPYDGANRLSVELSMELPHWAWVNVTLRPWYVVGARSLAYETAEQLGGRAPDRVVVPAASGALALQVHEGFAALGLSPRMTVVQAEGCAPIARAFTAGTDDIAPVRPQTRAASLAMGDPPDGPDVLAAVRATRGTVIEVPEDEIEVGVALLARTEGIDVEAAGGVTIAALARLAADGVAGADEEVVVCLTGGPTPRLAATGEPVATIPPTVEAFLAAVPPPSLEP
jgi:threonine synthase